MSKPTAPQARFLAAIVDGNPAPQNVVGDWRPINTCKANGWVIAVPAEGGRVTWEITPEGRSAIGRDATATVAPLLIGKGQNGKGAEAFAAEVRAAIPVPTPEEFRARLRAMSGTPAMPATPVPAPLYYLATDPQAHLMHATSSSAALCGEPAQRREPIANGDVSRVDCLACLDRYMEGPVPLAGLTKFLVSFTHERDAELRGLADRRVGAAGRGHRGGQPQAGPRGG